MVSKYRFNMAESVMPNVKLKCGAPRCDYMMEELSAEIAWGLLQFHRQDNHVQQGVGDGEVQQPKTAACSKS